MVNDGYGMNFGMQTQWDGWW